MLIEIMKGIGILYYWTWFIWPFVFIGSLVYAIKVDEGILRNIITAAVSLLIILAGIVSPAFS